MRSDRERALFRKNLDRAAELLKQGGLRVARMADGAEFHLLATSWRELRLIRVEYFPGGARFATGHRAKQGKSVELADFPVPLFLNLLAKQAGIVREVWTFSANRHDWSIRRVGDRSGPRLAGRPRTGPGKADKQSRTDDSAAREAE